jgi:rhamnulokinase
MSEKRYLIFDYGASHGRCLVARFDGRVFISDLIHEFDNRPVNYAGSLYWDILRLASELDIGLVKAFRKYPDITSMGIDTWGCDFGFIDEQGRLLANPCNYRDEWRHKHKQNLDTMIGEYEIFRLGGANTNPIMGLYHLYAMRRERATELKYAKKLLMIPDLLNYYLTGEVANEYTNATMTLMVDQRKKCWQYKLIDRIGADRELFSVMREPGTVLGLIRKEKCTELGIPSIPVITTASHDTASAIAGIPARTGSRGFAFISLGTWAIFGQETERILTDQKTFKSGFANQGGVEGRSNFVNLLTGLWIIQQCRHYWNQQQGGEIPWNDVVDNARRAESGRAFIDVQDTEFSLPSANMPQVIKEYCARRGCEVSTDMGSISRIIFESMVLKFKECYKNTSCITGDSPDLLHIIGGGVQNRLLCQWTSDALGVHIMAGPTETTSVGNLIMQMKALGDIKSVDEGRLIASASSEIQEIAPIHDNNWDEYYKRYKRIGDSRV